MTTAQSANHTDYNLQGLKTVSSSQEVSQSRGLLKLLVIYRYLQWITDFLKVL